MSHSPLATSYIGENKNFSSPSQRTATNLIVVHHMAGILTPTQCNNALKGRGGSIHYAIGNDGSIGWGIDEREVAWHAGNWPINQRSIGIETSNSSLGGDWPVSDAAYNSLVKLVADIAKRNNMGTLVFQKNIGYHGLYASTACPGPYLKSRFQELIDAANKINGDQPTPPPQPTGDFLPSKGYWKSSTKMTGGDTATQIGAMANFMYKVFPAYTNKAALGTYFGPNLRRSIIEFQRRTGLERDGNVGPITYGKLKEYGFTDWKKWA